MNTSSKFETRMTNEVRSSNGLSRNHTFSNDERITMNEVTTAGGGNG
jgi:hypothetical protein